MILIEYNWDIWGKTGVMWYFGVYMVSYNPSEVPKTAKFNVNHHTNTVKFNFLSWNELDRADTHRQHQSDTIACQRAILHANHSIRQYINPQLSMPGVAITTVPNGTSDGKIGILAQLPYVEAAYGRLRKFR